MKTVFLLPIFILFSFAAIAQNTNEYSIRDLKGGVYKRDSSYIYWLPFAKGKKYFLVQAYDSKMSHKGELALDFKMKPGSAVCAARDGIVVAMREDSDKGGMKDEYLSEGNYIMIRHNDGTQANYWHLQKDGALVNAGDTVQKGQQIGLSGNTGYTAFPHLHFEVVPGTSDLSYRTFWQLPTRFFTKKGVRYIRPAHFYKCVHN